MSFEEWFNLNWYSNCFTVITVVLSGVISLVISAVYYHKGNRNNLKMSVVHPIVRLLKDKYTWENYNLLCKISEEYSTRYMNKNERQKLMSLLSAYKEVSLYNENRVKADMLFSYFEYKLKQNDIDPTPVPIEDEDGEIIDYNYPPDKYLFIRNLEKALDNYPPDFYPDECKKDVVFLYNSYCKENYTSEEIIFFDDYTITEELKKSKICVKWDNNFSEMERAKKAFLDLNIVKKLSS